MAHDAHKAEVDALAGELERVWDKAAAKAPHTPGPWHVLRNDVVDARSCHIASAQFNPAGRANSTEQMPANARLIAAAPDLLAALQKIATGGHWLGECIRTAQAAIAKAEGRD